MEANGRPEIEDAIRDDDKHETLAVEDRGLRGSCGKKAEAKRAWDSKAPQLTRLTVDYFKCLSYEACEVGTSPSSRPVKANVLRHPGVTTAWHGRSQSLARPLRRPLAPTWLALSLLDS